ncbi:hypothetical protein QCA50_016799 [Cerrena zonata]|uniref:1,3-beta-glucanosyltransferase n=1 Tax=Cerrena zonata TaxID=2478898 RepID=A0AAW0FM63_9APHY
MQFSILVSFLFCSLALAIQPIEVKGNAFFVNGSKERFFIRGVDYQPGGSSDLFDPLADKTTCERDIKYFKELGLNTIRVYSIDNTADHDDCMEQLADAGIYVILDVNIPYASIARDDGECSYNTMYLNEVLATVKLMAKYNNTLGYFAANEVINDDESTGVAPYVKAVVRDMKTFIKNTGLRKIPVGYSAADVKENRLETAHYFNCGDDEMARVDMFGFNDYSWCVNPRPFTEVESIYSTDMSSVFSGGLVYEYSEESNKYGLVKISSDNKTVSTNDDFDNLKAEFKKTENPKGDGEYQADLKYSECPTNSSTWEAKEKVPSTPKGALKYIKGYKDPKGTGFKATTQWACTAKGNDDDDSDKYKKGGSSSSSSSSSSSGSGSSSDSPSSGSSSSKSSDAFTIKPSKAYLGVLLTTIGIFFGLIWGLLLD